MKLNLKRRYITSLALALLSAGCQQLHPPAAPPPYVGTPVEVLPWQTKGLRFVTTVTFNGMFAEQQICDYAASHHYRYYVITLRKPAMNHGVDKTSAMIYR
ncbi:hypothetical protein BTJ39_19320 [Izhakiella australiensis]|uniref:Uncharacterized protein n=1 Tax=Izhakiella australiensis TaxID=1926881 RepID=A0A1S8YFV1_9GAMM|nr:hypothetical protein [Izhakiella australiensis]OON37969.1 hypothetical protein BTJ39_19320 [Izhakiella australiensis]